MDDEVMTRTGFASAWASDAGKLRTLNEDAVVARPENGLWAVADGMGGHQAGDLASQAVIDGLASIGGSGAGMALLPAVHARLAMVNAELRGEALRRGPRAVVGSTVAVLLVEEARFTCVWAGDSRAYRLRAGRLER